MLFLCVISLLHLTQITSSQITSESEVINKIINEILLKSEKKNAEKKRADPIEFIWNNDISIHELRDTQYSKKPKSYTPLVNIEPQKENPTLKLHDILPELTYYTQPYRYTRKDAKTTTNTPVKPSKTTKQTTKLTTPKMATQATKYGLIKFPHTDPLQKIKSIFDIKTTPAEKKTSKKRINSMTDDFMDTFLHKPQAMKKPSHSTPESADDVFTKEIADGPREQEFSKSIFQTPKASPIHDTSTKENYETQESFGDKQGNIKEEKIKNQKIKEEKIKDQKLIPMENVFPYDKFSDKVYNYNYTNKIATAKVKAKLRPYSPPTSITQKEWSVLRDAEDLVKSIPNYKKPVLDEGVKLKEHSSKTTNEDDSYNDVKLKEHPSKITKEDYSYDDDKLKEHSSTTTSEDDSYNDVKSKEHSSETTREEDTFNEAESKEHSSKTTQKDDKFNEVKLKEHSPKTNKEADLYNEDKLKEQSSKTNKEDNSYNDVKLKEHSSKTTKGGKTHFTFPNLDFGDINKIKGTKIKGSKKQHTSSYLNNIANKDTFYTTEMTISPVDKQFIETSNAFSKKIAELDKSTTENFEKMFTFDVAYQKTSVSDDKVSDANGNLLEDKKITDKLFDKTTNTEQIFRDKYSFTTIKSTSEYKDKDNLFEDNAVTEQSDNTKETYKDKSTSMTTKSTTQYKIEDKESSNNEGFDIVVKPDEVEEFDIKKASIDQLLEKIAKNALRIATVGKKKTTFESSSEADSTEEVENTTPEYVTSTTTSTDLYLLVEPKDKSLKSYFSLKHMTPEKNTRPTSEDSYFKMLSGLGRKETTTEYYSNLPNKLSSNENSGEIAKTIPTSEGEFGATTPTNSASEFGLTTPPNSAGEFGATTPNASGEFGVTTPNAGGEFGATTPNSAGQFGATTPNSAGEFGATTPNSAVEFGATTPNSAGEFGATTSNSREEFSATTPNSGSELGATTPYSGSEFGVTTPNSGGELSPTIPNSGGELGATVPNSDGELGAKIPNSGSELGSTTPNSPGAITPTTKKGEISDLYKDVIDKYENIKEDRITKGDLKDMNSERLHEKIAKHLNWERIKKFFGHERVCNCKCKANKTMCTVCSASDSVIRELAFEFNNLADYMNTHCTEIQTFFWMNPSGGKKLRDTVHRIDKTLHDYYKRVKGKCTGRTCKTFATYLDKRRCTDKMKLRRRYLKELLRDLEDKFSEV